MRILWLAWLLLGVAGCTAYAADQATDPITHEINWTPVVTVIYTSITLLLAAYFRSRDENIRLQMKGQNDVITTQLAAINAKLAVISKVEVDLAMLPSLSAKIDLTTTKVGALELDIVRNYVTMPRMEQLFEKGMAPLSAAITAVHRRLDDISNARLSGE